MNVSSALENVSTPEIKVAIFAAAIESFFQSNMNCDNLTSVKRFKVVIEDSKAIGLRVRAYISVVLKCPLEGLDVYLPPL
ncbi:unnamed protein product [Clonostachys rosea f. rosea IK726]|uniref:Uncharacterized protein n=1 Tax=Clonostachys rosea f. rosea IK726 TaxID=1349383 RepID=A0ACA9TZ26_BIOOC|nr:unnamed protein product [Clonostachys rosea f. rosea IK726]